MRYSFRHHEKLCKRTFDIVWKMIYLHKKVVDGFFSFVM